MPKEREREILAKNQTLIAGYMYIHIYVYRIEIPMLLYIDK